MQNLLLNSTSIVDIKDTASDCNRKKTLLLCNVSPVMAETIYEHITAFENLSKHNIVTCSIFGEIPDTIPLNKFDVILIHYSICVGRGSFLSLNAKKKIRNFKGYKVLFIQDDFRWIYSTVTNCYFLGINALFGVAHQDILDQIYPKDFLKKVYVETILTGYVSEKMLAAQFINYADRKIDVSYRARKLPFWIGRHALQKWEIAEKFSIQAHRFQLKCDISTKEKDRVYGQAWLELLKNSKATLGTESGASICDFTGKLQKEIESFSQKRPKVSFEMIERKFLQNKNNHVLMNVISPRIFEAISHKVLLILYPGKYNDILIPWKHYLPLNQDYSNIEEVISILRSPERAQKIIECAYDEVLCNPAYHYQALIDRFDTHITHVFKEKMSSFNKDYIWNFNNYKEFAFVPGNNLNSFEVVLKLLNGEFSFLFLLRYIKAYIQTRLTYKIKSISRKVDFHANPNKFCSYLSELKQANFFHFKLDKLNLDNSYKSCEISCSLKSERNSTHAVTTESLKLLKQNETINVRFIYTEYAEAFLDSLIEPPHIIKIQLNKEFIMSLISSQ